MKILTKIFQSSEGQGLAKRWESLFSAIIPLILIISQTFDLGLLKSDLAEFNRLVVVIISGVIVVWKAGEHLIGWSRRNWNKREHIGKFAN